MLSQTIKESMYIRVNNPTLDKNVGKYNFHHICDRVLLSTTKLRINNDNGLVHRTPISGHAQSLSPNRHAHGTTELPARSLPPNRHVHSTIEHLSMHIEHLRTNIRHSNSPFPSDLMKSSRFLNESLSTIPIKVLLRESTYY